MLEHGYDFSEKVKVSTYDPIDRLLAEGKQILNNIAEIDKLDLDEISETVKNSERALKKFEDLQKLDLDSDPEFLRLKEDWLGKCEYGQRECEEVLAKLDQIEEKVKKMREGVKADEDNEKEIMKEIEGVQVYLPSAEEIDQEISAKVEEGFVGVRPSFSDLDDITPENLPKLYYVYERVLQANLNNEPEY